jgi:hypothetical protein
MRYLEVISTIPWAAARCATRSPRLREKTCSLYRSGYTCARFLPASSLSRSSQSLAYMVFLRWLLGRFLQCALLVVSSSACSIHLQRDNEDFDKLCGKGPVLIVSADETALSTSFFRRNWTTSQTIKHLVMQRGTPEAISVEREFLKPHRLKLFYPATGQVYLLDQVGGEWLVAGSEPLERKEFDLVIAQRTKAHAAGPTALPARNTAPVPVSRQPVAAVAPAEFRGMLKPPVSAGVATLTTGSDGTFVHTVTFPREDLVTLADWYTDNASNAVVLARSNHRSLQQPLAVGEKIAIPRGLMRNRDPLPEAAVP